MFKKIYNALGIKGILISSFVFLFIIFCVQNNELVSIDLFFWELTEFPKLYLLISLTLFGFIGGFFLGKFGFKKDESDVTPSEPNII